MEMTWFSGLSFLLGWIVGCLATGLVFLFFAGKAASFNGTQEEWRQQMMDDLEQMEFLREREEKRKQAENP